MLRANLLAFIGRASSALYIVIFTSLIARGSSSLTIVGEFFLVYGSVLISSICSTLGSNHYNIKWLSRNKETKENPQFFPILATLLGCVFCSPILLYILINNITKEPVDLVLAAVWSISGAWRFYAASVARYEAKNAKSHLLENVHFNIVSVLSLSLVFLAGWSLTLSILLLISSVSSVTSVVHANPFYMARHRATLGGFELRGFGKFLTSSFRMLTIFSWPVVSVNVLLWVVAASHSADETALVGAAQRLVQVVALPLMVLTVALKPYIISASSTDRSIQHRLSIVNFFVTLALGIVLMVLSPQILQIFFGGEYLSAAGYVVLLVALRIVLSGFGPVDVLYAYVGDEKIYATLTLMVFLAVFVIYIIISVVFGYEPSVSQLLIYFSLAMIARALAFWAVGVHSTGHNYSIYNVKTLLK